MTRLILLLFSGLLAFGEEPIVFRSDVALVRVDAQVVDRNNRAITGLELEDFVLFEGGQKREIRNLEAEDMPMDVLFLLDVSGSMQPHVQRIASAADQALRVLGPDDRVGIMVFDRATRLRLPLRKNGDVVVRELENVLNQETFDGGTDITRGLFDAAAYLHREGRRNARRAIVILTDDQTERGKDETGVMRALSRADAVLSALIAPDAMGGGYGGGGGSSRRGGGGGGGWPSGGGGGMGGPLGGIIFGRRGPYGTGGSPFPGGGGGGGGPVIIGRGHTSSAGTEEIAKGSGGDSMRVDDAAALEETLTRLRQRYALHFNLADAGQDGERDIELQLSDAARRRYPGSEVRYRRAHAATDGASSNDPVSVSRTPTNPRSSRGGSSEEEPRSPGLRRRRPPLNDDGTRIGGDRVEAQAASEAPAAGGASGGGWRRADETDAPKASAPATAEPARATSPAATPATPGRSQTPASDAQDGSPQQGGWRRVKPGEQP